MSEIRSQTQREALGTRYRLGGILERTLDGGIYLTEDGALAKLRRADSDEAEALLARWSDISRLSHPHLAQLFEAGYCEIAGERFVYAVMERAEESLAGVLNERPLSPDETREMLDPALDALSYIHANGYVHSGIQPSNILALGDTLKLSSDTLVRIGEMPEPRNRGLYDAPEMDAGRLSPASDIWSLGVTTLQSLTQRIAIGEEAFRDLPEPFADIVRHSLKQNPAERWTTGQITARLHGPVPQPAERRPEAPRTPSVPKWPLALGATALVGIAVFIFSHRSRPVPPPAVPPLVEQAAPSPAPPPPRVPAAAPAVVNRRAEPSRGDAWFVVVATYGPRSAAEKRAREISRRWPQFKAEVFQPRGVTQHLVVIGSGLSQPAADALRKRARAAGLPRDVFIKKFPG
jgi:eukaryotic-like serine/threonine-protein kinase